MLEIDAWVRSPRLLFDFLLVIGAVLFYILFSDELGYFIAAPLALAAFLFATGTRALVLVPVAVVVPLIIHYIFYTLLKVPLPWGLLTPLRLVAGRPAWNTSSSPSRWSSIPTCWG